MMSDFVMMRNIWILIVLLSFIAASEAVIAETEGSEHENYDALRADNSSDPPLVSSKDLTAILGIKKLFGGIFDNIIIR